MREEGKAMLKAKDFRSYAKEALKGRWLKAGGVGLLAGLLGGSIYSGNSGYSGSTAGSSESAGAANLFDAVNASSDIPAMFFCVHKNTSIVYIVIVVCILYTTILLLSIQ